LPTPPSGRQILLAKMWEIYYPKGQHQGRKTHHRLAVILFLFISIVLICHTGHAELIDHNAESYRLKGYEEQQAGHIKQALKSYIKALSLGLKTAVIYNDIGVVYEQLGIADKAQEFYLKSIAVNADYLPPYTNLAYFYLARGDTARAVTFFQERLDRGQEDDPWQEKVQEELYKISPDYRLRKMRKDAQSLNQELIQKARDEFSLQNMRAEKHYRRGHELMGEQDFSGAIEEFENALVLTPENPRIFKARELAEYEKDIMDVKRRVIVAMEKLEAGELESAKEEFQKVLTIIPNEPVQISK